MLSLSIIVGLLGPSFSLAWFFIVDLSSVWVVVSTSKFLYHDQLHNRPLQLLVGGGIPVGPSPCLHAMLLCFSQIVDNILDNFSSLEHIMIDKSVNKNE